MALLEVRDLRVAYGQIEAVRGISFDVDAGHVVALIGSNGAGKTTTLRTLSGLHRPSAGEVRFDGKRIDHLPAHEIVALGVAHAPEGRRLFHRMTIRENLDLGAYRRNDGEVEADVKMVYEMFPVLAERRTQTAGTLSGGEQQMLAIEAHLAGAGPVEARQRAQGGGLAGAVAADEGDHVAGVNVEADAADGLDLPVGDPQVADFEESHQAVGAPR
jgi:ABC-type branched-subunit amino acid transport system ATPase component